MSNNKMAIASTQRYAKLLYQQLYKESRIVNPEYLADQGFPVNSTSPIRIFEGFLSELGGQAGIRQSAIYQASSLLAAMEAVTSLRKSNKHEPSLLILHYEPLDEHFDAYRTRIGYMNRRIAPNKYDEIKDRLSETRADVGQLQKQLSTLGSYIRELEISLNNASRRIAALEARVPPLQ